jgi:crossover junction endodeoxyribonuclease RusA
VIHLALPYPPSVNHYWRRVGGRTLVSRGGRQYRSDVVLMMAQQGVKPLGGDLLIRVDLYPPDRRRRDADNALKALLDALGRGGAYHDDYQLSLIHLERHAPDPEGLGRAEVYIARRAT